jgi:hypothetical protein
LHTSYKQVEMSYILGNGNVYITKYQYNYNELLYLCYLLSFFHIVVVYFSHYYSIIDKNACWKYINIMNNGFDLLIPLLWWWKE